MPSKLLHLKEQEIKQLLRRNGLITAGLTLAGFSLLIPAFSVEGSRFDYQEFCFKPPVVHTPNHQYCKGEKIRRGIAWKVALERSGVPEFREKITLLRYLPAQNPNAGACGLSASMFLASAFAFFRHGTEQVADNLDVIVANKRAIVLEHALEQDKHISIQGLKATQEKEFITDLMNRDHATALYTLMADGERDLEGKHHAQRLGLEDAEIEAELALLKAKTAEAKEKELKHQLEAQKLIAKSKTKDSTSADSAAAGNEQAKDELLSKLKDHEGGWLYTVVMTNKPVFLIGSSGAWKSYCSAAIALARYYLKGQKLISITDPHLNKNLADSWKELIPLEPELYGGAQDWAEVSLGIQEGFNRWNKRTLKDEPVTSIWDEQTNWPKHEQCVDASKEFMGRVISDPRKSNEGVMVITHSFTNAGTGGGGGFAQAREEGVLQLHLNSDNEMRPLFKGKLLGFKDDEGELVDEMKITIPKEWFNPSAITKMFKG